MRKLRCRSAKDLGKTHSKLLGSGTPGKPNAMFSVNSHYSRIRDLETLVIPLPVYIIYFQLCLHVFLYILVILLLHLIRGMAWYVTNLTYHTHFSSHLLTLFPSLQFFFSSSLYFVQSLSIYVYSLIHISPHFLGIRLSWGTMSEALTVNRTQAQGLYQRVSPTRLVRIQVHVVLVLSSPLD